MNDESRIPWWEQPGAPGENRTKEQYETHIAALKESASLNTDREIWRGPDDGTGSAYADSLHITKDGALGINCSGIVHVRSIRNWHALVVAPSREVWRTDDGPGVYTLHIKRAASDLRPTADWTDVLSRSELVAYLRKEGCPPELVDIVENFPPPDPAHSNGK